MPQLIVFAISFVAAFVFASFVEYWLHRLMHVSAKIGERHRDHHRRNEGQGVLWEFRDYVLGSAIAMHKDKTKRIWQACGLPTPRFVMLEAETDSASVIDDLGPVFVKPVAEGSSFGLATADTADDLEIARGNDAEHAMPLMAEARIHGDELTVAILGDRALPAIQIVPQGGYYDFDAKYVSGATEFICPAPLSPNDANQLQTLALAAFQAVGAHGWGRVDLMRDDSGWWLLEINTVPGMTETSLVPKAAAAAGMSFETLLAEIYLSSEARYGC